MEKIIYHVRGSATKPPVLEILEGKGPNNLYFVSEPFRPTDLRVAMGGHDVYALKKTLPQGEVEMPSRGLGLEHGRISLQCNLGFTKQ